MVQCETCWKDTPKEDMCTYNGKPTCNRCAAKFIKHAFGRDKKIKDNISGTSQDLIDKEDL